MKVVAFINGAEGKTVEVETAKDGDDDQPRVSIQHDGHWFEVDADEMIRAIQRARISQFDDYNQF